MGLRPTNTNEGASGRCRGIDNLDRAFNRVLSARIPETFKHPPSSAITREFAPLDPPFFAQVIARERGIPAGGEIALAQGDRGF